MRMRPLPVLMMAIVPLAGASCGSEDSPASPAAPAEADGGCTSEAGAETPLDAPPIHTPRWAFEPWISKDISNGPDTYAFVEGFEARDIPVGVVVIDSPWETHYNTFVPNEERYPEFGRMVSDMHAKGVRVVLWVTPMINDWYLDSEPGGDYFPGPSPNLEEAVACGFLVNDGAMYTWWKGRGGAIDFFNPAATAWWHRQQDALLEMGINGWKLDFGESYVRTAQVQTAAGTVTHQEYSEAYYRDFYAYGASKRGTDEFITMVRPWDESYDFEGRFFARPEHAPVAWVGDQRRDWIGLSDALDHIFRSADAGYVVVGSDVGGYLDFDDKEPMSGQLPFDLEVFQRWTAMGAMTPFMQLHGRTNLTPWSVPGCDAACTESIVALYRYWSKLHHELVPFFYSLAQEGYAAGQPILHPQGDPASWPGDYRFVAGDAFLVAPVLDASGTRDVTLPAGARWYDWWDLGAEPLDGGTTLAAVDVTDVARIPIYLKQGAIVPLDVSDEVTGMGTNASAGRLSVLVAPPSSGTSAFALHDEDDGLTSIEAERTDQHCSVTLSRLLRPLVLRVLVEASPSAVAESGVALTAHSTRATFDAAESGWWWDEATRSVWVRIPAGETPRTVGITTP